MPRLQPISRRSLLAALAAGSALAACTENPATGRRQLMLVSDAQLAELADAAWADLTANTPVLRDAAMQTRLARVGEAIAQASGRTDLDWDFVVFDNPEINAFVLPNGKVGFFRGLLDFAHGDADQIAAVMGHEAGHVVARHAAERLSQQLAVGAGVALAEVALAQEYGQHADDIAAALGMGALYGVILPYSRRHEFEADALGVTLTGQAGLDPAGAVTFWERMVQTQADRPQPLEFLSTHPTDQARLAALRSAVGAVETG